MSKAGRVGIYFKNSIIHTLRKDFNFTSANYESVWLSMGVYIENNLVGLIYRHPGNPISDSTKQFSEFSYQTIYFKIKMFASLVTLI